MAESKTIGDFERERGVMLRGDVDPDQAISAKEFDKRIISLGFIGMMHKDREAWLKSNDYELTRANFMDASLASKPQGNTRVDT